MEMKLLQRLWKEESGQGLVEYGLLVALIVVIVIAVLVIFSDSLTALFTNIGNDIAPPAAP
ncbi:MAG: Flp/Fap pilin protein [Fusobacteria bacterium]|nr:MAG: Flp/Fap pilin protein [Fusobacteriota bacterium]KAF0229758.1 MAG: Flp/Fap pilin [Fusobacteriota bacterium]